MIKNVKNKKIEVKGLQVTVTSREAEDYISLTDIALIRKIK